MSDPAFDQLPDISFKHVLTFASSMAVLPEQLYRNASIVVPLPALHFLQPYLSIEEPAMTQGKGQSESETRHFIFLALLDHGSGFFAVVIPVEVELKVFGTHGAADQVVVRRAGNLYRMRDDFWFNHAHNCIVHFR